MSIYAPLPDQIGPYRVIGHLGGGGFSEVLLARDSRYKQTGPRVAIKRLRPGLINRDPIFLDSVLFEAELGMMLSDPHVVRVDGVFDEGGEPMIVMEYIEGHRVDRLMRALSGVRIPVEVAAEIIRQVCEGLVAVHNAHDAGGNPLRVVHQDIKPANLIITHGGVAKLLDFGMARPQQRDRTPLWVRQGTPGYRSPEQSRGEAFLTPASDLYGVGVVFFELLEGRRLFRDVERDREWLLERQRQLSVQMEVLAPRLAPPGLDLILQRLLAFDPRERYSTSYEVVREIAQWQRAWNRPIDLAGWLQEMAPRLEALPEEGEADQDIHNVHTEIGERVEALEELEPEVPAGNGNGISAVRFASFDMPAPAASKPLQQPLPSMPSMPPRPPMGKGATGGQPFARQLLSRLPFFGGR